MRHTVGRGAGFASVIMTMGLLAACSTQATTLTSKLHLQEVDAVHVVSPRLSYAKTVALVPSNHYFGILAGTVTTCGRAGVKLTPTQMARHPVTVTLWHEGRLISSVRLERGSGFAFIVVGGTLVRFAHNAKTHEQPFGWAPGFAVRTSTGFAQGVSLGGLGGIGEEDIQISAHPQIQPCYPKKPPSLNIAHFSQSEACRSLAIGMGAQVSPAMGEHAVMVTLTNVGWSPCQLFGYPRIALLTSWGRVIPFIYVRGQSEYMSNSPASLVTLAPSARAYVEVTKYRCDLQDQAQAAVLRLAPPNGGRSLAVRQSSPQAVGTFSYCEGGPHDPGNLVSISRVSASAQSLFPR